MRQHARTYLSGGRSAMPVPTATVPPDTSEAMGRGGHVLESAGRILFHRAGPRCMPILASHRTSATFQTRQEALGSSGSFRQRIV